MVYPFAPLYHGMSHSNMVANPKNGISLFGEGDKKTKPFLQRALAPENAWKREIERAAMFSEVPVQTGQTVLQRAWEPGGHARERGIERAAKSRAAKSRGEKQRCFHWDGKGKCSYGYRCKFSHTAEPAWGAGTARDWRKTGKFFGEHFNFFEQEVLPKKSAFFFFFE